MDRGDKLINNRPPKRILLFFGILFLVSVACSYLLSGFLADAIMREQINSMLSVLGGGKFTALPDADAIAKGESLITKFGVDAQMHPSLMEGYAAQRMTLFWILTGFSGILCIAGAACSLRQVDVIYNQLEEIRKECFAIAEQQKTQTELYGEDFGCVRRICEGVNLIASRMTHLSASLYGEKQFLKDFLTDFSHQMKTSLAVIRLNHDMLTQFEELPQEKKDLLSEEITLHLNGMETLVLSTLKLAKLNADAVTYEMQECDLSQTCRRAAERLSPLMRTKNIHLCFDDTQEIRFLHDAVWLGEAIGNLLKNFIDHSECTELRMELERLPGAVKLMISDNGKGIPQSEIPTLFERFGRKSNNATMQSAGVGLAIAKQIIEAHHGDISVYSELGRGTRFEILFLNQIL